jgi:hypothetical protein
MYRLYQKYDPEDFQAKIRFLTLEEGGQRQYPNGIRFDFQYVDDLENAYMIHPDFFDSNGNSFSAEEMLPLNKWINARMYIIVPEIRETVHRFRIKEGVKFYCCDGKPIAEGIVTRLVRLAAMKDMHK